MQEQDKIFKIDDEYGFLTKELIEKEYYENKLTDKQIAEKYNIGSKVTVWRRRKFHNIENKCNKKTNNNASKNREFSITKEQAEQYLSNGLTYNEIANKMGCSRMVAYRRMKELGIIDNQKQNMQKLKWHEPIGSYQNKFLLGCLLGDGNITSRGMFQCNHSWKQKEYIYYKYNLLRNLIAPDFTLSEHEIRNSQNNKTYYAYYMRTMQNEFLFKMYNVFYNRNKKIFPNEFLMSSDFDDYSLAVWYMDDGSRNGNSCSIHSQSFNYVDNLKIIEFLYKKFNVCGVIQEIVSNENNSNHRHYVRFNVDEAAKFFRIVSPYIIPMFQYKLPLKYRTIKYIVE